MNTTAANIPAEHLAIPRFALVEMIVRSAARANENTNRIVVEEAHEQNAYWTSVLVEILRRQGFAGADLYASWLVRNAEAIAAGEA